MLHNAMNWLRRLFGAGPRKAQSNIVALTDQTASGAVGTAAPRPKHIGMVIPYDEHLLERARTQWQFGDWQSLAAIGRDDLEHHPDRARLALLAAAGHAQLGDMDNAKQLFQLAEDWGCSKRLIAQILISGVHNSLGRAAANIGQEARALDHFTNSITIGAPGSDARLLTGARVSQQITQLNLADQEGTQP